ncbi:MAG: glycosyltransferase [Thiothrix sp.]|nr:MAG: glycosyltransferase [Thiothrix sp.]
MVLTLADELQAQGHTCHIICFKRFQELRSKQVVPNHIFPLEFLRWLPRSIRGPLVAPLLDRFIRLKIGIPDLVLSNLLPADRILSHSKLPNVQLVVHNTLSQELLVSAKPDKQHELRAMLASIYALKPCICVSRGVLEDLQALLPTQKQAVCIYNPVDLDLIATSAQEPNPIKLPEYFIHVGKFKQAKRHDRLLRAYALSAIKTPLVLVGQGELLASSQALAEELGISERVMFAGFHSNPYPLMAGAKGLLLASDFEGLGLVILEALALKVPVISTDCPSGPNEILPAANLIATDDLASFADKLRALDQNPNAFQVELNPEFAPRHAAQQYLAQTTPHKL